MKGISLPHFLIAGAARSGTTWLYQLLDRHPEIYMAKPAKPEPKFFSRDAIYKNSIAYYSKTWFADAPSDRILGEKSTGYLEIPETANRIHAALPGVKLIFILREPSDRAFSNYLWSKKNGLEALGFYEALQCEEQRESLPESDFQRARPYSYFSRGLYAQLLVPFLDRFEKDQFLFLRYEDLASDPGLVARRLHEFLGVKTRIEDVDGLERVNSARENGELISNDTNQYLRERYVKPNLELSKLLGSKFPMWTSP